MNKYNFISTSREVEENYKISCKFLEINILPNLYRTSNEEDWLKMLMRMKKSSKT